MRLSSLPFLTKARLASLALLTLMAVVASASNSYALTYKFYKGTTGYTGPFNGILSPITTVYEATAAGATNCPTPLLACSADVIGDPLVFSVGGQPTVTATAGPETTGNVVLVWDDLAPNFGGLGVKETGANPDDQIDSTDVLTLTFGAQVNLTGIATLFAGGHTPFGPGYPDVASVSAVASTIKFQVSLNGGASWLDILFQDANNNNLSLVGTTFMFREMTGMPSYYISALQFSTCGPTGAGCSPPPGSVPLPGALPLFTTALGGVLFWRRKRKAIKAAAATASGRD